MSNDNLDLASIQAEVLYTYDADNRMLAINEPDPEGPAPRFFLLRTLSRNIWRTRYDLPEELSAELGRLVAAELVARKSSALRQPPLHLAEYTKLLEQHAPISENYSGPAYYLPKLTKPTEAVIITPENADLLKTYFPYTYSVLAERSPVAAIIADGLAVAACYSVRSSPLAVEAGVDTIEAYRKRGYAYQTVIAWANAVSASGKLPLYSTSWDNLASQAVAAKLGAIFYGVDFNIT